MRTLASILIKVDSIKLYRALEDRIYHAEYRVKADDPLQYRTSKSLDDLLTAIDKEVKQ